MQTTTKSGVQTSKSVPTSVSIMTACRVALTTASMSGRTKNMVAMPLSTQWATELRRVKHGTSQGTTTLTVGPQRAFATSLYACRFGYRPSMSHWSCWHCTSFSCSFAGEICPPPMTICVYTLAGPRIPCTQVFRRLPCCLMACNGPRRATQAPLQSRRQLWSRALAILVLVTQCMWKYGVGTIDRAC